MTEPNATEAIEVSEIDAEIDAILNEESVPSDPPGASEEGTQGEPKNDLKGQLSQLGLNIEVPSDLSPQMEELLSQTIAKADERVRGFQSGIDRTHTEFGAKAKVYDQLMAMPEFHDWIERGGGNPASAGAPAAEVPKKLDLSTLPTDAMERLQVLVEHFAEAVVRKHTDPLEKQVGTVGAVVGRIGWEGFVATHPDAPAYKAEIDNLIARGFSAEKAYRYAKGASVDEKGIETATEERLLARFRERMQEVKKASGTGLPRNIPGGQPSGVDYTAIAETEGLSAAILKSINEIDKELGGNLF